MNNMFKVFYNGLWASFDDNFITISNNNGYTLAQFHNEYSSVTAKNLYSYILKYIKHCKDANPSFEEKLKNSYKEIMKPIVYTPIFNKHKCLITKIAI